MCIRDSINDEWVEPSSGAYLDSENPFTGEIWARVARGNAEDADLAVKAAKEAFENSDWADMRPTQRGKLLVGLAEIIEREKNVYLGQAKEMGKPEAAWDKIVQGKLEKFYQEQCLLEQSFIKDPNSTIKQILTEKIAKLGENISIARFTRYQLGQE